MQEQPHNPAYSVVIHIDGSCLRNPGPGGWSYVYQALKDGKEAVRFHEAGADCATTNVRMEMQAAIEAYRPLGFLSQEIEATIVTDSEMLFKGMTEWLPGWKRRGWKKADGKPVLNGDLWAILDDLQMTRPVRWAWTRAHIGTEMNEAVDQLARAAALRMDADLEGVKPLLRRDV